MRRRAFLGLLAAAVATPAAAQQPRPARIGVLSPQHATESPSVQREPFERGLRDLGWMPGTDILIDYRYADGQIDRLSDLAAELVQQKVDLIVVRGPQATAAALAATSRIPIVMSATPDPVGSGFAKSLARPGGSVTGLAFAALGPLDAKRLDLLKETLPELSRVAFLYTPTALQDPDGSNARALAEAAGKLGIELRRFAIRAAADLPHIFAEIGAAAPGALLVAADPHVLEPHRVDVVAHVNRHRLPAMYPWRLYVEVGGLMSYNVSIPDFHRRSSIYVDRILKGANPGDLPIEQPSKLEFVVNLKAAKALGLAIPHSILARADEVIE